MEHSPSWEAKFYLAIHKSPHFYATRRFITMFKRARHWSLSWVKCIHFTLSVTISLKSILILSSQLRIDLRVVPSLWFLIGVGSGRRRQFLDWYGFRFTTMLWNVFKVALRDSVLFSAVQTVISTLYVYCAYGSAHTLCQLNYKNLCCIVG
jgi:hypothetical protein